MIHIFVLFSAFLLVFLGWKRKMNPWIYMLMLPLAVYNTDNSDRYFNEWSYYGKYGVDEPGFKLLIKLGTKLDWDFQTFFAVLMCMCIILLFLFASRYTSHINLFGLLYLIYPFPLITSGIRVTPAYLIVLNAVHYLNTGKKRDTLKYICLVLLAGSFHFSALVFLIMILCNTKLTNRSVISISAIFTGIGCLFTFTDVFTKFIPDFLANKAARWLQTRNLNGFMVATVFHLFLYFVFYIFYLKMVNIKKGENPEKPAYYTNLKLIGRINAISLLFCILYCFNYIFFGRLYIVIELLNCLVFIEALNSRKVRWYGNEKLLYIDFFLVAILVFTINVNGISEYFGFWKNILSNNMLFK